MHRSEGQANRRAESAAKATEPPRAASGEALLRSARRPVDHRPGLSARAATLGLRARSSEGPELLLCPSGTRAQSWYAPFDHIELISLQVRDYVLISETC